MKRMCTLALAGLFALISAAASAATTGMCEATGVTTLWNRTPWPVVETKITARQHVDFGYSTPGELPALGGRLDSGQFLPDTTLWSVTALDLDRMSAEVRFTLAGTDQSRAEVDFEFGVSHAEWQPNGAKIALGATKLAVGVAADKVSLAAKGGIETLQGLAGSKTKQGLFLRVKRAAFTNNGIAGQPFNIIADQHDRTIVTVGNLSVVILPFASNCPHAGWFVTFMTLDDLKSSTLLYE